MFVIGICGGSGSGKTALAESATRRLSPLKSLVLPQDAYYKDNSHIPLENRRQINFDHPDALDFPLLIDQIQKLKRGMVVYRPVYSFLTCTRENTTIPVHPPDILFVEGILILFDKNLRDLMDLKVYISCDTQHRLSRNIERDLKERGRDANQVTIRFQTQVQPMHETFVSPLKKFADCILENNGNFEESVNLFMKIILSQTL